MTGEESLLETGRMTRVLDVLRGGTDNLAEDREAAAWALARWPDAAKIVRWCDRFAAEAARAAVASAIPGVIFCASGFPAGTPPHCATARGLTGHAMRFVYADWYGIAVKARAAALRDDPAAAAVHVPVTDPEGVLTAAARAGLPAGPVHVQLGLAATYLAGTQVAVLLCRWARELPEGSQVAVLVPLHGYLAVPSLAGNPAGTVVPCHEAHQPGEWMGMAGLDLACPVADVRDYGRTWQEEAVRVDGGTRVVAAVGVKRVSE